MDIEKARKILELSLGEYTSVRQDYWAKVYDDVYNYLTTSDRSTAYKSDMKRAMIEAFAKVAEMAYTDGGGSLPMDKDANDWLTSRQNEELGYIDSLFQSLKMMKDEGDFDAIHEAFARADGYSRTLDSIYANAKAMGAGNMMLTFGGIDGDESCSDCQDLKGQRHRAKWWAAHDLVPPSRNFECKGYKCKHYLFTDSGQLFSL